MSRPPGLVDAILEAVAEALATSRDNWVRAELPPDWPVGETVEALWREMPSLRVGVLRPFTASHVQRAEGPPISSDPQEMTRWRNARLSERAAHATLLLGDATGPRERGLTRTPQVIDDGIVIDAWRWALDAWLSFNVHSANPRALFTELMVLAAAGGIDTNRLDEYVSDVLDDPAEAINQARLNLWRLNLIPDKHLLDTGVTASRLALNIETRQFLLSASDTPRDSRRLSQLEVAAQDLNTTAKAALRYRASRDHRDLVHVDLAELLALFQRSPSRRPTTPRPLDLLEFFDVAAGAERERIDAVLSGLQQQWDLGDDQRADLLVEFQSIDANEAREIRVTVEPTPLQETQWLGDGALERQICVQGACGRGP